ncbi:MAG: hypothetical protein NVS9B15_22410 [Acidobacteriaceae bacterium]
MSLIHAVAAFVIAFVVCQLADWVFAGVLFHDKYLETPEIWRRSVSGGNETRGIAIAAAFTAISVAAFEWFMAHYHVRTYHSAFHLAAAIWLIAAMPVIATNAAFIRIHLANACCHAVGWLVKLAATALIVCAFIRMGSAAR